MNCGKGCGKCCEVAGTNKILMTTKSEALAIAQETGRRMDVSVGRPMQEMRYDITRAALCPFLVEGACSIYEQRPQVCRAYQCDLKDQWSKSEQSAVDCSRLARGMVNEEVADLRAWFPEDIDAVFARHTKIAFQFSGGKDSTALLLNMRPYWDRMTVYHLSTGDQHPDTTALIRDMANLVPITFIQSDVFKVKREHGLPSDVVPWASSLEADQLNAGRGPRLQHWVACCYRTTMLPLHERMLADGITLIIRGQKNRDTLKGALVSGDVVDGIEFLYPSSDLTDIECFDVLRHNGIPIPSYYSEGLVHSGDCLGCTAWNVEESRPAYLKAKFPERYARYRIEMLAIADAVKTSALCQLRNAEQCL